MPEVYENLMAYQNIFPDTQEFFYDLQPTNGSMYSPFNGSTNSQGTSDSVSSMSTLLSPLHRSDYLPLNNVTVGEPHITILVQPVEKFRFRYKSEMIGTHGSLVGANTNSSRKKHAPTVQLHNYSEKAIIRCTLVTSDENHRIPHAHRLVRRESGIDQDDPHHITVSAETGFIASFHGMGIIHTAKKHLRDELIKKMRMEALERNKRENINTTVLTAREDAQIKSDADFYQKCVNLNSVALCFQAFIMDQNIMRPITDPVYSNAINNLKSALTGELKICRIDKHTSSCEGGEEVFILVEKVGKKNIRIKFFELNDDDYEIWTAYGRFSELDVHHQYAIVFRTPPYKDLNITSPKEVFIQLERPSDADCSEPIKFTYKPSDRMIGRKRQRISYSGSAELSQIISMYTNTPTEEIKTMPSNESSELSKEIKKILSDGCSSADLVDCISQLDVDKYIRMCENSEDNMLTADGPSTKQCQDDTMFAKNVLIETIKSIKMNPNSMEECVKKLLKDRSTYGDSALHSALRYGQRDIIKYILMLLSTDKDCKTLINGQNSSGKTALHYAVLQNQPEITKALLMLGADPNRSDEHGFSPLHAAVRLPEAGACVDVLLGEKTIDIKAYNDDGRTALHLAAEAGSFLALSSLVQAGADVNNTDMTYGRTALHIAVEGGHKEVVEFLLKKTNIQVNKRNFSGNTALHTAVVYSGERARELCSLLLQYGADPHIQNHNRESGSTDKRKGQNVDIKKEIDSEEENTEESPGQSSFDLASNKPDILQLLSSPTDESRNETHAIVTKEEIVENADINWLNIEQKQKLSIILDKTYGWKKLATHVNFAYLLRLLEQSSKPALLLLNYIDVEASLSLIELENILKDIEENEAADYVAEIISTNSQSKSGYS